MDNTENGLAITGYVDRWSGHPGENLRFFVSTSEPRYNVQLVRLFHSSFPTPEALREEAIDAPVNGEHSGNYQDIPTGSCMQVVDIPARNVMTLIGYIMPTLSSEEQCTAVSWRFDNGFGVRLDIDQSGCAALVMKLADGAEIASNVDIGMQESVWYRFALSLDADSGRITIKLMPASFHPESSVFVSTTLELARKESPLPGSTLTLAAERVVKSGDQFHLTNRFNGRFANLSLLASIPDETRLENYFSQRESSQENQQPALARWDFTSRAETEIVPDLSGNGLHGSTINRPTRLLTGPLFDGTTENPFDKPDQFNAIHFHDDDLSNAGWEESFSLQIPEKLPSGVYAMKLSCATGEDYIPFCVTQPVGKPASRVAVLMPTLSYQVYANARLNPDILPEELAPLRRWDDASAAELYVDSIGMRSCYDRHNDGSGVCMATMLRPMPIMVRPGSDSRFNDSPHQLSADLSLIDWLDHMSLDVDIITDHELDRHGRARLSDYNVVLSGTHAEYWTEKMLDGLKGYTDSGGRFMYLSGNGLYWVTALSADGTLAEIRRDQGTRSWEAAPGEAYISLNGKRGGLWRHRGRAPQKYVGVGFASQGFDRGQPFQRTEDSYSSRARVFFEGIEDDLIGDFPVMVSAHGAAGYEFDRADPAQGTPSHALVLASASGFSDCYQLAVEDAHAMAPGYGGSTHPDVRADIVFYETPRGGGVFSASSIAWCSALSYNQYSNNVAQLTYNVLARFMRDGELNLQ